MHIAGNKRALRDCFVISIGKKINSLCYNMTQYCNYGLLNMWTYTIHQIEFVLFNCQESSNSQKQVNLTSIPVNNFLFFTCN